MLRFSNYLKLLRPQQWIKNLLVFAPIFFAVSVFNHQAFTKSFLAFVIFSFASSLVYVLNDIFDYEQDRMHPSKQTRPIASGQVSFGEASWLIVFLVLVLILFLYFLPVIVWPILIYILLNGSYSAWFKHIPVVDVVVVSTFYILRVVVGGLATKVYVSPWIILCVLFGALFIVVGKRRAEYYQGAKRKVLEEYSKEALDFMLGASVALAIISYGIYSVIGHHSNYLVYSVVFVLFALFKMLNRIYTHPSEAESPEILVFKDRWVLASFLAWVGYVFIIFYTGI